MSQRAEKTLRRVERLEIRVETLERAKDSNDTFHHVFLQNRAEEGKEQARKYSEARRCAAEVRREARMWRRNAVLALILAALAIAVCIVQACAVAHALVTTTPAEGNAGRLPGDDVPATERCYMTDEEIQALPDLTMVRVDNVTVTHYCICQECCGKAPDHPAYGITASGAEAVPGVTAAVDPDVIPLGATLLVDYGDGVLQELRAEDTGSGVKGAHIDVCVLNHRTALSLGVKNATVFWAP